MGSVEAGRLYPVTRATTGLTFFSSGRFALTHSSRFFVVFATSHLGKKASLLTGAAEATKNHVEGFVRSYTYTWHLLDYLLNSVLSGWIAGKRRIVSQLLKKTK